MDEFDVSLAHRRFAAELFNTCWTYIDRNDRTGADNEQMVHLAHASLFHWSQRSDCTDQNRSIGTWQLARVYVLVGRPAEALFWAERALAYAAASPPFYQAYGHEAVARAAAAAGEASRAAEHLAAARELAAKISDDEERGMLEADLATLTP